MKKVLKSYCKGSNGEWFVQLPSDGQFGFVLATDDQSFEGGFGANVGTWTIVPKHKVPKAIRAKMDFLFE